MCWVDDKAREFALLAFTAAGRGLGRRTTSLKHVIAYPDGLRPQESAPGTLDDYAFTAVNACIDGWLASGEMSSIRGDRVMTP